jgi:hypothetical protein
MLSVGDNHFACGYRGDDLQRVEKAVVAGKNTNEIYEKKYGSGNLLWCPLPLEMCDNIEAVESVYREAMIAADLKPGCDVKPDMEGILAYRAQYRDATLLTVLSEISEDVDLHVSLRNPDTEIALTARSGRAAFILLDKQGHEIMRSSAS